MSQLSFKALEDISESVGLFGSSLDEDSKSSEKALVFVLSNLTTPRTLAVSFDLW
jgi:hypothetical protein